MPVGVGWSSVFPIEPFLLTAVTQTTSEVGTARFEISLVTASKNKTKSLVNQQRLIYNDASQ